MSPNVGMIDRIVRVVLGVALIAFALGFIAPATGFNWIGWIGVIPLATARDRKLPALLDHGSFNPGRMKASAQASTGFGVKPTAPRQAPTKRLCGRGTLAATKSGVQDADDGAHFLVCNAVMDRFPVPARRDEALKSKARQLLRNGRLAKRQEGLEFADRFFAV